MLFASAVNDAKKAGNDQQREATSLGTMYFFAKLGLEAPNLNVVDGILQEAKVMTDPTFVKGTGTTCDAEFTKRGRDLTEVGQKLQAAASTSAPAN